MKANVWKRLVRTTLPEDQDWAFHGTLCYRLPFEHMLLGVLGEGSAFDKGMYVWRVSMPLFVPSQDLFLNYSVRIGGGSRKYSVDENVALMNAISEAICSLGNEESALDELVAHANPQSPNPFHHEVVAYSLLLLGDLTGAMKSLRKANERLLDNDLSKQVADRIALITSYLEIGDCDKAIMQLNSWSKTTIGALGLQRERYPNSGS